MLVSAGSLKKYGAWEAKEQKTFIIWESKQLINLEKDQI